MGPARVCHPHSEDQEFSKYTLTGPSNVHSDTIIDDQPGHYADMKKAYGPYEAIKLRQRIPNGRFLAKRNNENYVWFALVSLPSVDRSENSSFADHPLGYRSMCTGSPSVQA